MSEPDPSLILLIPAYNEEERIGSTLDEFVEYFLQHYRGPFRLIVVLNGCRDDTLGTVNRTMEKYHQVGYMNFPSPIGKGGALIEGLKLFPHADLIGYVDADGATGPAACLQLVNQVAEADCAIGSRWLPESLVRQEQSWVRRFLSRGFHAIVQLLFWMNIKDTQCPAKIIRRDAVEKIHPSLRIADLAFDVNLLYALKREKLVVREYPIEWTDKLGSKVTESLLRSSLVMFLSVVRLRLVYSPFYRWLRPLRPIETWLYQRLRAPAPLPSRAPIHPPQRKVSG